MTQRGLPGMCPFRYSGPSRPAVLSGMANVTLADFIDENRDELIGRCRAKVARRSAPLPTEAELDKGVPLFLDQLCEELRDGPSKSHNITKSATAHGRALLLRNFTISQVVHDYGDICQSITDLAVELAAPISTDDFRTLNRCLDDAIASAVTEFARDQDVARAGESGNLENFINAAITAFEVIRTGNVGVGGSTGAVVYRNLMAVRDGLAPRSSAKISDVKIPEPK
jgi:hypothetical protein